MSFASLLPYSLARPVLFKLDPEAAHDFTMAALERTQNTPLAHAYSFARVDDPVTVAGLHFPNRVGLAAGLDKNARCIDAFAAMGFGFIEVGTVTPLAQPGNPKPRMFRLTEAHALINRLGFNNEGLDAFLSHLKRSQLYSYKSRNSADMKAKNDRNWPLIGLNIGKNAATPIERANDDYLRCLSGVYPHADYITVNISSPNTKNLRTLQSDEALAGLLGAISERREALSAEHGVCRPIFLKIAPDLDETQIRVIALTVRAHGIDGLIATNTTISRESVAGLPHADEAGGLSGKPVFDKSNAVIAQLRAELGSEFPIIGVGGVMSGEDARAKLRAGANLVQIYTGLIYRGPEIVRECALALQGS